MEQSQKILSAERNPKRISNDFSFRSSLCSVTDLTPAEFYDFCKSKIKVSSKNINLQNKFK